MNKRLKEIKNKLNAINLNALVVTNPVNRNYLSGFTGSDGFALLTLNKSYLITDSRYTLQATHEVDEFEVIEIKRGTNFNEIINEILEKEKIKKTGFEFDNITLLRFKNLKSAIKKIKLVPVKGLIESLREIKDQDEINNIKKAVEIAENALIEALKVLKPGITEKEFSAELEYCMRKLGASGTSFETIVASGKRGAFPHGVASDKIIQANELVVIDFGAVYNGYCSDLTRTVGLGIISEHFKNLYEVVYKAQKIAVSAFESGVSLSVPDKKARNLLKKFGFDKYFTHGLGHGIGMEIHEAPSINCETKAKALPGMVVTVEPGVYLENEVGIRIENDLIIGENSCEFLGFDQKELVIL